MATYRKQLKDKDGNNIIPVVNIDGALEMIGFMFIEAADGGDPVAQNTIVKFSDPNMGGKSLKYEYDPLSCIQLSSGTCYYTHKANNKLIEAELVVTGNCFAFWLNQSNGNPLNSAVYITSRELLSKVSGNKGWGGATFKVYYDVSGMTEGDSFFINPQVQVYGGEANINRGGTTGHLSVKVFRA